MSDYHFERLTPIDFSFLVQETRERHMSVVGVTIFEAGPLARPGGGIDFAAIRDHTGNLLDQVPRYRQKLMWRRRRHRSGLLGREQVALPDESLPPVWVDDPHFDIDYHMRHTALPRPGGAAQLKALAGRIASQPLDRARPLWETWVVEGLSGGRFATVSKLHHCMIDGMSGADITQLLLSPDRKTRRHRSQPYRARPAPTPAQLERELRMEQLKAPLRLAEGLRELAAHDDLSGELARRVRGISETFSESGMERSASPINGHNGPHRAVDWMMTPVTTMKAIGKSLGGSINDAVLTVVSTAFRDFFLQLGSTPGEEPFRALVPVSIWSERQRGEVGNQIMNWLIDLPLEEEDPRLQMRYIHDVTEELKKSDKALGVKAIQSFLQYTPGLLSLAVRNASGPHNTMITNIPGPQMALYQMGAQMLENYPVVPMLEEMGLGIGVMSYNGTMFWGITVDTDIVADAAPFCAALQRAVKSVARTAKVRLR